MSRGPLRIRMIGVLCAVLTSVTACNSAAPDSTDDGGGSNKISIGVGGQTVLTYLPVTLAGELGYFEDEGLDVEIQDLQGGSKALQALMGGSIDVTSGYYEHTIQMQAKGQQIKAFVEQAKLPGMVLLVSPKNAGQITSVEDLKGKTVGVTSPGSSTDMFLRYLLVQAGLSPEDAPVAAIGAGSTAVAAVKEGSVDAAVMLDPAVTQVEKEAGSVEILEDLRSPDQAKDVFETDTWPAAVLYSKTDWVDKNAKQAGKLAKAITKALEFVSSHSGAEIAAEMPEEFAAGDPTLYAEVIEKSKELFSPDGVIDDAGAEAVLKTQQVANPEVGDAEIDLSKTYTDEFVD